MANSKIEIDKHNLKYIITPRVILDNEDLFDFQCQQGSILAEILIHVYSFYKICPTQYDLMVKRILKTLPSTITRINELNFNHLLEFPKENICVDGLTTIYELAGSYLKPSIYRDKTVQITNDVTAYIQLLALIHSINKSEKDSSLIHMTSENASYMIGLIELYDPFLNDSLRSMIFRYASRALEKSNSLLRMHSLLFKYLNKYRSLMDTSNSVTELTMILLRQYIKTKSLTQAASLVKLFPIPSNSCTNSQMARYHYFSGIVYSIKGDYNLAKNAFSNSLRLIHANKGLGLRETILKHLIVVQLLSQEIPEKRNFEERFFKKLFPYFLLSKTVYFGRLDIYKQLLERYHVYFMNDGTHELVQRLHSNVVMTSLNKILNCYTRISFEDVASKLQISSPQDAEYFLAKVIRARGLTSVKINHREGYIITTDKDQYFGSSLSLAKLHSSIMDAITVCQECYTRLKYDTKEYYNKIAHDDLEFINEDDTFDEESNYILNKTKNEFDRGPSAGM